MSENRKEGDALCADIKPRPQLTPMSNHAPVSEDAGADGLEARCPECLSLGEKAE